MTRSTLSRRARNSASVMTCLRRPCSRPSRRRCFLASSRVEPRTPVISSLRGRRSRTRTTVFGGSSGPGAASLPPPDRRRRRRRRRLELDSPSPSSSPPLVRLLVVVGAGVGVGVALPRARRGRRTGAAGLAPSPSAPARRPIAGADRRRRPRCGRGGRGRRDGGACAGRRPCPRRRSAWSSPSQPRLARSRRRRRPRSVRSRPGGRRRSAAVGRAVGRLAGAASAVAAATGSGAWNRTSAAGRRRPAAARRTGVGRRLGGLLGWPSWRRPSWSRPSWRVFGGRAPRRLAAGGAVGVGGCGGRPSWSAAFLAVFLARPSWPASWRRRCRRRPSWPRACAARWRGAGLSPGRPSALSPRSPVVVGVVVGALVEHRGTPVVRGHRSHPTRHRGCGCVVSRAPRGRKSSSYSRDGRARGASRSPTADGVVLSAQPVPGPISCDRAPAGRTLHQLRHRVAPVPAASREVRTAARGQPPRAAR